MARGLIPQATVWAARRELAKRSFAHFIRSIDIPGAPTNPDDEDCEDFHFFSVREFTAHHALLIEKLQALADTQKSDDETLCRNLMVFMPPGSAKSTYASVLFPAWLMVRRDGYQFILGSYAQALARKMGRRTRALFKSKKFRRLFPDIALMSDSKAADEFALTNGSEYMAAGVDAGVTGNRADGICIDDPLKGRAEAESETMRSRVKEGYDDDFRTRAKPFCIKLIILTRWHEDDLAGQILPDGWDGESGRFECRDGEAWDVLRVPAESEGEGDPLGRPAGAFLWPEWFPASHWTFAKRIARTWSSLYQGRPSPEDGDFFRRDWFELYHDRPERLKLYGASDYAVSEGKGDYTWLLVWGICPDGDLWLVDGWNGQTASDAWVERQIDLTAQYKPFAWFGEAGVIQKAMEPTLTRRMRERRVHARLEWLPSIHDKPTRARGLQAYASMGRVHLPDNELGHALLSEMLKFPNGKHDDGVDTAANMARAVDEAHPAVRAAITAPRPKRRDYGGGKQEAGGWR